MSYSKPRTTITHNSFARFMSHEYDSLESLHCTDLAMETYLLIVSSINLMLANQSLSWIQNLENLRKLVFKSVEEIFI